ncbi:MAG TPA: metallophosphoesterase [Methanobacterium sp.]|nr:metallophosphoesterase [Methanobacterium sp.]
MEKKIIQISDLHFGEFKFSEKLKTNLKCQIEYENPDLIVIAGDITSMGYIEEYNNAREFIDELISITDTYVVPGNHDACNVGLIHFKRLIGDRRFVETDKTKDITIIGLDSSEPDIHDGKIGFDQLEWLNDELNKIPRDKFTIVTFHHHLLPIPQTGRERNILLDSGDVLKLLVGHGVNMVLNGHKHVSNAWKIEDMVILNSGTATTRRLYGDNYPSYNKIQLIDEEIISHKINTETGQERLLARHFIDKKIYGRFKVPILDLVY